MAAVRFSKQYIQPNPMEVDYWVDLSSDITGGNIKYHNGTDWVDFVNSNGATISLGNYYDKNEISALLSKKASYDEVNSKVDEMKIAEVIKDIKLTNKGEYGIELLLLKYDNATVGVTLPVASSVETGVITPQTFKDLVKQNQLLKLYSEIYDKLAEIRSQYQPRLKAGNNIVIDHATNTIHAKGELAVGWDQITNRPDFKTVATTGDYNDLINKPDQTISNISSKLNNEISRATAKDTQLENRIDDHFEITNAIIDTKADKSDTYTKDQVNEKLSGVYKVKGSSTFENLPTSDNTVGDVYNITNVFTLTDTEYPVGTNVVWTTDGWDALSGIFDTTELEGDIQTVASNLSNEISRATLAEQNIKNTYLPLSGGTLVGGLTISVGNLIVSGGHTVTKALYPTSDNAYTLGNNERYWANVYTKLINGGTPWHSGNDGSGSGLDADLLDGLEANAFQTRLYKYLSTVQNAADTTLYSNTLGYASGLSSFFYYNTMFYESVSTESKRGQVAFGYYEPLICYRVYQSDWSDWKIVAFTDSNVASATKLQTARTIWGQSFDGTGDVSGAITNATSGSFSDNIIATGGITAGGTTSNNSTYKLYVAGHGYILQNFHVNGNVGVGTTSPTAKLHVAGDILATGTITQESQRDLKDIIDEKVLSLDDMSVIKPTRFKWKDGRDEEIHYGGIAEDIQQVIPEVVHKPGDNLTVEYGNAAFVMVASLVEHVKALTERVSFLENECEQLRKAIA